MPFDGSSNLDIGTKRLIEGRAKLENGWCQRALQDKHGAVCILGAILADMPPGEYHVPPFGTDDHAFDVARCRLSRAISFWVIQDWNNDPKRTKADVLALFDYAIAMKP